MLPTSCCPPRPGAGLLLLLLLVLSAAPAPGQHRPASTAWWAGAGALLGGAALLDGRLRATVPPGGGTRWEPLSDGLNPLGNPRYLLPALGGAWAAGKLAGEPELSTSAAHVVAGLLAAGAVNGTLKFSIGRERPVGGDRSSFRPFNADNRWQSFPSGHTVVAFSLAATISAEADRPWVTALGYTTASLVGWSRIYEDRHWASDVVGGAVVGVAASRAALRWLHRRHPHGEPGEAARLLLFPGGVGVSLPAR